MLTLESKFSEFIQKCIDGGACSDATDWMTANNVNDITLQTAIELYEQEDASVCDTWAMWAVPLIGKDIEESLRFRYIRKISMPLNALKLYMTCDFLNAAERTELESKFQGAFRGTVEEGNIVRVVGISEYEQGLISHIESRYMKFSILCDNPIVLVRVEGSEADIDEWVIKASGVIIDKAVEVVGE